MRGKVTPMGALKPHKIPKADLQSVQAIYEKIESRPERYELNLYIAGEDEDAASGGRRRRSHGSADGAAAPRPRRAPKGAHR